MNYKAFISMLYIKGTGITKDQFTKNLFLSSVYDTSVIIDKRASDSSYKGYNRGNPIDEIACDVISQPENINISGIEELIEKYLNSKPDKKSEYEQRICGKFKNDIPDITPENICKRIAAFFIDEVLTPASNNYKEKNNISDVDVSIKPDEKNNTIENDNSVSSNKVDKERDVSGTNTTTNIFNNRVEDNSIDAKLNMAVQKNYDNHNEDNSIDTTFNMSINNNYYINKETYNTTTQYSNQHIYNIHSEANQNIVNMEPSYKNERDNIIGTMSGLDINSLIGQLNDSISSLLKYGHRIYDQQSKPTSGEVLKKWKNNLDNEYDLFLNLYEIIDEYNSVHNIKELNNILSIMTEIEKDDFIASRESFMIRTVTNYNIHKLLNLIHNFSSENNIE